ncbi:hypothetical protein [Brasilonema bromeliae]|uniref:hypothetical protein n=1 Tax=Brasilonema bromeliae TaxID=383615 RepID=UPI00145D1764|nr:hypothetical protein [Brasilonema bromeliae]
MSKKRHIFDIDNLTVGIIGAVAGVAGLVLAYGVAIGWTPGIFGFGSKDPFSCALQPDTQNGGEVWMVMYRNDQRTKPWLRWSTALVMAGILRSGAILSPNAWKAFAKMV